MASSTSTMLKNDIKDFLTLRNQCPMLEAPVTSRTLVLMDATGSMTCCINKTKNAVKTMFTRAFEIMAMKNITSKSFEVQFAVYRNYNASHGELLQYSGWESNSDHLFQFMDTILPSYGMGNESVEVGLWHANNEVENRTNEDELYQVILIGDMPPNTDAEVDDKRESRRGEEYWRSTKFCDKVYCDDQVEKLRQSSVPIHCFYVDDDSAKHRFQQIAHKTGGECQFLDVDTPAGAEELTHVVTQKILKDVGGREGTNSNELVAEYRKKFMVGYTKD